MKTCYIFGAADGLPDRFKKNEEDLVIAADSGINHLEKFGALPDIAVGDFDSLGFVPDYTPPRNEGRYRHHACRKNRL